MVQGSRFINAAIWGLCLASSARADPPPPPQDHNWQVVEALSDDFSHYNATKWRIGHPYWDGRPPSVFHADNAHFGHGLEIKTTIHHHDVTQKDWLYTACVSSNTPAFHEGMYAEARLKAADLAVTSAFWMQGKYSEIDVAENWGQVKNNSMDNLTRSMMVTTHYFAKGWDHDLMDNIRIENPNHGRNADDYHIYGVWFKDSKTIILYLDGQVVARMTPKGAFNEPMYMFFDVEPQSWGPGLPVPDDITDAHNTTSYSYVKTWVLTQN